MHLVLVYTSQPDVFFIRKKKEDEDTQDFLENTIGNLRERKHLMAYQLWDNGILIRQAKIRHRGK